MSDYKVDGPRYHCSDDIWAIQLKDSKGKPVDGWVIADPETPQICASKDECVAIDPKDLKKLIVASKPTDRQQNVCKKFGKTEEGTPVMAHLALITSGVSFGASHFLDRVARHDLYDLPSVPEYNVPDHGTLEDLSTWGYIGLATGFSVPYTLSQQFQSPEVHYSVNGICGGGAIGYFIAAGVQKNGRGTPELNGGMLLASTCSSSLFYGHAGDRGSDLRFGLATGYQASLGLTFTLLGAFGVGGRPDPIDPDDPSMYVDPSIPPESRDIDENPVGGAQFTSVGFLPIGISQLTAAAASVGMRLIFPPNKEGASVALVPMDVPEGAGLSLTGNF